MNRSDTSLRTRLFLGLAGLVVLFLLAQVWLVRSLTRELSAEVDHVALQVGTTVASFFTVGAALTGGEGGEITETIGVGVADAGDGAAPGRHVRRIETIARQVEESSSGGEAKIWVWSPGSGELIEAPGDDVSVVIPTGGPVEPPPGGEARDGEAPDGEAPDGEAPDHAFAFHVGSHGQIKTLRLQTGENAQVHLGGDVDARFLMLEGPGQRAEVPIPRLGLRTKIERFQERLWLGSGLLLLLGLVSAAYISHRVSTPLAELAEAAEKVGGGELGVQVAMAGGGREIRRTQQAFNDMSGRLRTLDERNRRLEGLRHLEEIGDVARGLAHSLRNPLNALGLSVEQLADPAVDGGRKQRLVDTAGRQLRRLDAGIRSFLVLASPGEGAGTERVSVSQLLRDVALEAIQDAGGRVGVDVESRGPEGGELELPAVAAELRAVVQALVVNAVEASPDGGRVRARLSSAGENRLLLEVADRGPGLPEQVRARLGTPHVSTKPNGSGMGLFLARRIAGFRYGGSLELLDREGGGTVARLEIGPRRLVATAAGDTAGDASGDAAGDGDGGR